MKAALLKSEYHVDLIEAEMPELDAPDHLLIQVKAVGICGSEIHAFEGTHPWRKAPVIMGHEMAGCVVSVGSRVNRFQIGDRVLVDPQWMCGQCSSCRRGDINLCLSKVNMGTVKWPGAFGEYIHAPEELVFHLPEQLSYVQGAMIEPLSVAIHIADRAKISTGKSVAILGSGSIGGMLAGVSSALGASPIIVLDIKGHCLAIVSERMGATHDILLPDNNAVSAVKEITAKEGVDAAIVCADDVSLINLAIQMVKPRGVIVLVALLTEAPTKFMAFDIIRKEITLTGSYQGNKADVERSIELALSGQVKVDGIVTHVLPIEQAQRGCDLASTKDDKAIKVVLTYKDRQ